MNQGRFAQNNTTVYLAGPLQYDKNPEGWRNEITPFLTGMGIKVLNPCTQGHETEKIHEDIERLIANGDYEEIRRKYRHIRNLDLRMVDKADFLIVYLDLNIPTVGTYEELFWGNRSKKPVLCVIEQEKNKTPYWLLYSLPSDHLFSSFQDLKDYLLWVNSSPYFYDDNRWIFIR